MDRGVRGRRKTRKKPAHGVGVSRGWHKRNRCIFSVSPRAGLNYLNARRVYNSTKYVVQYSMSLVSRCTYDVLSIVQHSRQCSLLPKPSLPSPTTARAKNRGCRAEGAGGKGRRGTTKKAKQKDKSSVGQACPRYGEVSDFPRAGPTYSLLAQNT